MGRLPKLRARDARDLGVLFGATVLAPALLLAVVGVRAFLQERRADAQQANERLSHAAEKAAGAIETALRDWTAALAAVGPSGGKETLPSSPLLGAALREPGADVLIWPDSSGTRVFPQRQLLYLPEAIASNPAGDADRPSAALAAGAPRIAAPSRHRRSGTSHARRPICTRQSAHARARGGVLQPWRTGEPRARPRAAPARALSRRAARARRFPSCALRLTAALARAHSWRDQPSDPPLATESRQG